MIQPEQVVKKAKDTPWNIIDEEAVLLNLDTGHYYILNETGCRIWELLDGKKTVAEVVDCICTEYAVSKPRAMQDIIHILHQLYQEKLVEIEPSPAAST